jgi:hypothetical protein
MPVKPEVAKEGVAVVELIAPAIVEIENVHAVEAVAPVVEQEELTINEPMFQPPALEVEASSTPEAAKGAIETEAMALNLGTSSYRLKAVATFVCVLLVDRSSSSLLERH